MFRIGALIILIALVLSLHFGCKDETTEAQPTGLELGFGNCLTFNTQVFIDGNFVGSFSSEREWFIEVPAGSHSLEAHSNLVVTPANTKFCWTADFSVTDGQTTQLVLDCLTAVCPADN